MSKHGTPPARGEDNALQGYDAQYSVASELILKALPSSDFVCAILKDFKAEKVDDIQIVTIKRVDAYQVKWHVPPTSLTPGDLKGTDTTPENGLARQLADGWAALKAVHPAKEVFVHLYTTSNASTSAISDISKTESPPRHLAEFINAYWKVENPSKETLAKWQPLIQKFQTASGLPLELFENFRTHCQFDLNRRRPKEREEYAQSSRYYKDIEHLQSALLKKAGQVQGTITLTRKEILDLAGWSERFDFKARHEFPTPACYVPIDNTVQKLEQALQQCNRGYLALIGTPGSGKSTLLTRTLRYRRNVRVFRYYCFVPDDTALSRGEAYNFLHDLVLTLTNEGIRPWGHSMGDSIEELRTTFAAQIREIGNLWTEQGLQTIVLIDGLDHIRRESNPQRSLINELPQPSALPQGCVFVLGTQRLENIGLNRSILDELQASNGARIISMGRLKRREIRGIISKQLPSREFQEADIEAVVLRSAGHPLALGYILNRISNADPAETDTVLNNIPEYADNIEREYEVYWRQLENDDSLRNLLALISRIRGTLDLEVMSALESDRTLRKLVSTAKHYFIELPERRWRFFHNSFRQFVLDKTGRSAFGFDDEVAHRSYHARLAKLASENITPRVFQWERLYHTYHSGDYKRVLELGTQEYFREQYFASRPAKLIIDDTKLVMKAAREQEDALAAIRVLLIEAELNQRSDILDECEIHDLLIRVGKHEEAIKHVLFEGQLYIGQEKALEVARKLADAGYIEAANEIFELSEPLDKLSGTDAGGLIRHGDKDILDVWLRTAIRFRSLDNIKQAITNLEFREGGHYRVSGGGTENLRALLYIELADAIIETGEREAIEQLKIKLGDVIDEKLLQQRIAYSVIAFDVDPAWKDDQLNYLLKLNNEERLPDPILLRIVAILLREKNDLQAAKELFDSIPTPPRVVDENSLSHNFGPYILRLRYYRLRSALGDTIDPVGAVVDTGVEHQKGDILIERMVIRIANLWGKAWQGTVLPATTVINELLPALRIIELRGDGKLSLSLSGKHKLYIEMIIYAAAAHGEDVLKELSQWLEKRWQDAATSKYWFQSLRRHAALIVYRAGGPKEELVNRLTELEPSLGAHDDVREYLESCTEQLAAWEEIDELDRGYSYIELMIKASFGIYHEKDPQIYYWTKWYQTTLEREPGLAKSYFRFVAQGVATASAYSRGGRAHDASIKLLSIIASTAPDLAERLKQLFRDEDVLNYHAAIEALLISGFNEDSVPIEVPYALLVRLYLPYVRYCEEDVIEAFINKLVKIDRAQAVALLGDLVSTVKRDIAPPLCGKWWASLEENLQCHSDVEELLKTVSDLLSQQKPKADHTKGSVLLNDGTVIEEDELLIEGKNPDRLIEIVGNIKEDHFYRWHSIVNKILGALSKEQSEKLLIRLAVLGKSGRDVSGLINKQLEFGSTTEAERYALEALKQSRAHGWSHSYDGGSRIEPYKTLIKIDEKYRRQAFNQFVDDYLEGNRPYHVEGMLDDLVSLFWRDHPTGEMWKEIHEHFSQLREFSNPVIRPSSEYELGKLDPTSLTQILIKQVIEAYGMPQPELREDAFKALVQIYKRLPEARDQITGAIDEYLKEGRDSPLLGTALIRGISSSAPELIERFREILETHLQHDDMAVRLASRKTLSSWNGNLSVKRDRPLPASYTIELPAFETMADSLAGGLIAPNATLPETNDSLQLVGTAQEALEIIHRKTGIGYRNLVERTALLMETVLPKEEWNSEAEKALQARCKLLRIETAYRRPRAMASSIALGHVIGELFDAELLDENDLYLLEPCLSILDLTIARTEPVANNLTPVSIAISDDYTQTQSEWVEAEPDMLPTPPVTNDGWTVLGFVTRADVPRWEYPSEYITGSICSPHIEQTDIGNNPEAIIPGTMMALWWLAANYPGLPYLKTALARSIVIRAQAQRTEIGRASWLAINPIVAHNLGWSLNAGGLFEWSDGNGKIMAKSQWWRNGRLHRHAPADGVRAEGWIVKASPKGFDQLKEFAFPAKWVYGVRKRYDKEEADNAWVSIFDLA
ncbi:MAG: ATP-binding protein [Thiogranum sp.]|nr:ATP-binding protein [Thiogranum sp.]